MAKARRDEKIFDAVLTLSKPPCEEALFDLSKMASAICTALPEERIVSRTCFQTADDFSATVTRRVTSDVHFLDIISVIGNPAN